MRRYSSTSGKYPRAESQWLRQWRNKNNRILLYALKAKSVQFYYPLSFWRDEFMDLVSTRTFYIATIHSSCKKGFKHYLVQTITLVVLPEKWLNEMITTVSSGTISSRSSVLCIPQAYWCLVILVPILSTSYFNFLLGSNGTTTFLFATG